MIEVGSEELPALKPGEVLVRVAAAGLNHAETLIRSGNYVVRLPFPYAMGGEGAGTVVAPDSATRFWLSSSCDTGGYSATANRSRTFATASTSASTSFESL